METLRSSLAAAERLARDEIAASKDTASSRRSDETERATSRTIALTVVLVGITLLVTNVLAWRALTEERALRVAAEKRGSRADATSRLMQSNALWAESNQIAIRAGGRPLLPVASSASPVARSSGIVDVSTLNVQLAKKLADPAAREALRDKQKGGVIQLYGELFKRWHLSGPAAQPVLDALADHELQQVASALSGVDPGIGANGVGANAADNAAVRAVLNTKQLEDLRTYDSTLTDRMMLGPFLSELELAQTPLGADRVEQLVNIIHDERLAVPQPSPPSATQSAGAYVQALDEWQAALDERVRDQAALILPAGVLSRLETFQISQRAATAIFAPTEPQNAPTTAGTAPGDSPLGPPGQH